MPYLSRKIQMTGLFMFAGRIDMGRTILALQEKISQLKERSLRFMMANLWLKFLNRPEEEVEEAELEEKVEEKVTEAEKFI